LFFAADRGNKEITELLLDIPDIDPDVRDSNDETALARAIKEGHVEVAELLLEKGGATPDSQFLLEPSVQDNEKLFQLLLETGDIDPSARDDDGQTPLSLAAKNGREGVVNLLLQYVNTTPHTIDHSRRTPL
jgi:ankyrin repeat protein